MKKKYDTNPLDPDILRSAESARRFDADFAPALSRDEAPTQIFEAETRPFAAAPTNEMFAPPRTVDLNEPYQSMFAPRSEQTAINKSVSSAAQAIVLPPTNRTVSGLGLSEKWAMVLPYLPLTIGAILAVAALFFAARSETRVRFHAAQALALHLASWIAGIFLNFVGGFALFGKSPNKIFQAAVMVYFFVSIVRVWRGKPNHIEMLDDVTDFLNDKIKPRK